MKCFLMGVAGFFLAAVAAAVLYALYSDYSARLSIDSAIASVGGLRNEIREILVERRAGADVAAQLDPPAGKRSFPGVDYLRVSPDGTLVLRGAKHGQIIMFEPTLRGGEVAWKCVGSKPEKNIPTDCR